MKPLIQLFIRLVAICLLLAGLVGLAGCATYKRCQEKFASTYTDTTTVEQAVTVVVPKDSVVLRLRTDTTTVYKTVQQGRARVEYIRTPVYTEVQAECLPDTIVKTIASPVHVTNQTWGVPHWWRWLSFFLGSVILIGSIALFAFMRGTLYKR